MKRHISTISLSFLLLFAIIFFSACGGGKPQNISEQHYRYALKAIEIADDYLDYSCSASSASEQMKDLYSREAELPKTEFEDPNHHKNYSVESYVYLMQSALSREAYYASIGEKNEYADTYNLMLDYRNELSETVGEKKR